MSDLRPGWIEERRGNANQAFGLQTSAFCSTIWKDTEKLEERLYQGRHCMEG
jgi:hypothetical protein